jgi:hypothetical protein
MPTTTGALVAEQSPTPTHTNVHQELERAAMAGGDISGALSEATLWLESDPGAAESLALATDLRTIALGSTNPDAATTLLQTMGSVGVDALYDLAYGYAANPATSRARKQLAVPAIIARASPPLAVTLALREARTCDKKKALLQRARELGDVRTLAVLREYQPTRGCGFLGRKDCWGCLHRDESLASTIAAITDRVPAE